MCTVVYIQGVLGGTKPILMYDVGHYKYEEQENWHYNFFEVLFSICT